MVSIINFEQVNAGWDLELGFQTQFNGTVQLLLMYLQTTPG